MLDSASTDRAVLLKLRYPNCKNHGGIKVLLFKGSFAQIIKDNNKIIDPHFGDETTNQYKLKHFPVARFSPEQWQAALNTLTNFSRLFPE